MARTPPDARPVGILTRSYPALAQAADLEEILGLERLGRRLHVFALEPPADPVTDAAGSGVRGPVSHVPDIEIASLGTFLAAHAALLATAPRAYLSTLHSALARRGGFADFLRAGWLARRLKRERIAHLHAHSISYPADVAELVGRLGVPFSISAGTRDIWLSQPDDLRRKLDGARFTVTRSEYDRHMLAGLAPRATIHRMYRGVDPERFHPRLRERALGAPLVLAVGRLCEKKGFDTLIEACRILVRRNVRFRCDIVGWGEEHAALEQRIDAAGLFGVVVLTGKLPHPAVIERYACASVFVAPSRIGRDGDRDDIPDALMEAMAMEIPVVATRVSGIPELVRHDETGFLVEPDAPQALAEAIRRVLADKGLRLRLGQAGRKAVTAGFDARRNLQSLDQLLEKREVRDVCSAVPARA